MSERLTKDELALIRSVRITDQLAEERGERPTHTVLCGSQRRLRAAERLAQRGLGALAVDYVGYQPFTLNDLGLSI